MLRAHWYNKIAWSEFGLGRVCCNNIHLFSRQTDVREVTALQKLQEGHSK